MKDFHGGVAFVTGGASGIGRAIASALGNSGMHIMIADTNRKQAESTREQLRGEGITVEASHLNVADPASWALAARQVEETFGPVRVLVNSAGVGSARHPLWDISEKDWRWIFGVNVDGVFQGIRTFVPRMKQLDRRCQVVNLSSIMAMFARANSADYVATKYATLGLSESLRFELDGTKIGVSVVLPAHVRTQLASHTAAARPSTLNGDVSPPAYATPSDLVGIDCEVVAERVIEAITENRFYVWTNPEYLTVIRRRMEEIERSTLSTPSGGEVQDTHHLAGDIFTYRGSQQRSSVDGEP